jgi:hypothetical protein
MNKGAIFSRHRPGDEERLRQWLGSPQNANSRVGQALSNLPSGHRIPRYPPAYERFLTQAS